MSRSLKMILVATAFVCSGYGAMAQTTASVMKMMQTEVERTESNGDVVDDVLYEYIFRDQSSTCTYLYQLFDHQNYALHVLSDNSGNSNFVIRIYKSIKGEWMLQKVSQANSGVTADLDFSPEETARYKIEVSCVLSSNNKYCCFGLLIIKKE